MFQSALDRGIIYAEKTGWTDQEMESYKQSIPAMGLSLERCTSEVPNDGYYYVLLLGKVKGRHRSLKKAQAQYKELLDESGWRPTPQDRAEMDVGREAVEKYMDDLETYWADSHRHSRRGGKTMYRR